MAPTSSTTRVPLPLATAQADATPETALSSDLDDTQEDDPGDLPPQGWFATAFAALRDLTWPAKNEGLSLAAGVIATVVALGALVGALDLLFSRLSLRLYGSGLASDPSVGRWLAALDLAAGVVTVIGVFAQKPTSTGLSAFGGLDRSRFALGAAGALRVRAVTYVAGTLFLALAVVIGVLGV